jgi:hypothetical protein
LSANLGYLPSGVETGSTYGAVTLALFAREGSTNFAPGVAIGYRVPVVAHFAVRFQANYRRWIEAESNEVNAVVILGLVGG